MIILLRDIKVPHPPPKVPQINIKKIPGVFTHSKLVKLDTALINNGLDVYTMLKKMGYNKVDTMEIGPKAQLASTLYKEILEF